MTRDQKIALIIALLIVGGATILFFGGGKNGGSAPVAQAAKERLAVCLADGGTVLYGADWCPRCQEQKELFGDAFAKVKYVRCELDPSGCLTAGVDRYPTWILPGGQKITGVQTLDSLSQLTACPLE